MPRTIKILFLAANPLEGSASLRLDHEAREVMRAIRSGARGPRLEPTWEWAVRTGDLQEALLRHEPQVVHFSGHGDGARGIVLEGEAGGPPPAVSPEALVHLLAHAGGSIRVVILNACDTRPTIEALREVVDFAIGMDAPITDHAAIVFSTAFYRALAFGRGVDDAFALGLAQLRMEGIGEDRVPVLLRRPGVGGTLGLTLGDEEEHYLRTLVSKCDEMELFGVSADAAADAARLRVSEVFVAPNLTLARGRAQAVAEAVRGVGGAPAGGAERGVRIQALDALAAVPRLVVLGDAGGGKSTLVSHVAAQLALRRLGEPAAFLPGWRDDPVPFPVVVRLRDLAARLAISPPAGPPGAGWVWDHLREQVEGWGCAEAFGALREHVRRSEAAVFFDGLDEVPESAERPTRTLVARALRDFAAPLPAGHVVVTCRRYAYLPEASWSLPRGEFPVVALDRFDLFEIRAFALQWHRGVGRQAGWSAEESERRALAFYEQIRAADHLKALAASPLLLSLMARIHRDAETLPEDRAQLYERAVELMLAEWENRKEDGCGDGRPGWIARLGIPTGRLRDALCSVAFRAHAGAGPGAGRDAGATSIPEWELLRAVREAAGGSLDRAEAFVRYVETRAGLLVRREEGAFAFPHRTFQEYLAATHLLRAEGFAETLLRLLQDDPAWWREVFSLSAAALADDADRLAILADAVLAEAENGTPGANLVQAATFVAHAMAGGRFAEARGVRRYTALASRMSALLAEAMRAEARLPSVVRAAAGAALARLGDPRREVRAAEAMPFCFVPAGGFRMGSPADDPEAYPEEMPLHEVRLSYGFWIGRFPVTMSQYAAFDRERGAGRSTPAPGVTGSHPAAVSWHDATAFCRWLTERLRAAAPAALAGGALARADRERWTGIAEGRLAVALPNEAEWEKAARGGACGERYPWGETADPDRANYQDAAVGGPSVVGCFPGGASPSGVEETSGNVWEWTRSLWGEEEAVPTFGYPYDPADGREDLRAPDSMRRVLRGGSCNSPGRSIRSASRFGVPPAIISPNCGFRVVVLPAACVGTGAGADDPT